MHSILRRALVFVATLSLGGAALVHSGAQDALAKGGQDKQQQTQTQPSQQDQQQAQQQQEMSVKQQAQYVESWADAEEPSLTDQYSSDGFQLLYSAFDGLTQQLQQQPIGGGPTGEMTQEQQQQQQQQEQQIQQALQQIQSEHQQLKSIASKLEDDQELMQRPQQFQQGATSVVNILDSLQQAKFNDIESQVQEVRQSVNEIDVNQPLAAQQDNVQSFFVQTSKVLNQMADQLEKEQAAVGGGPADSDQKKQNKQQNKQQ